MTLNSVTYIIFLPIVYAVFAVVPLRMRWVPLLLFSIYFYMTIDTFMVLFLFSTILITFLIALIIGRTNGPVRLFLLWLGIIANIMLLIFSRYPHLLSSILPVKALLLSVGVSYYVFQAISYLVDVHLEIVEPERHLGYFALYLSFFPKLLQGPIERGGDLLPQLKKPYVFNYELARSGMLLFAWGLFKKVVVADRLEPFVNVVYNDVHAYQGIPLILATYCYAFQLYFDFSGYTDMALGSARLFNIHLTQNFNSPYLASSVADFWRRWHISFSRWILDYIFKPLQILWRDWRLAGTALALLVTFLISGIWHGASLRFVVWGALHGILLASSVYYKPWQKKLHKFLRVEKSVFLKVWQILVTFNLVCFTWIFFRANSVEDATYVVQNCLAPARGLRSFLLFNGTTELVLALTTLSVPVIVKLAASRERQEEHYFAKPFWVRWAGYCLLLLAIMLCGVDGNRSFVYFRF